LSHSRSPAPSKLRYSIGSLLAFSSPALAATLLISPVFGILPSYYALNTKVTLAEIGGLFLIARVLDALIDPLIGILSDRTQTRLGARLPWMIAGGAMSIPSVYFLFLPPHDATAVYFLIWSFVAMFAWTLMTIPHGAWAAELTDDYDERSRIFGVRNVLAQVGGFGFLLLPPLLAPITGTTEIERPTMWGLVIMLWVVTPLSLLWAALRSPGYGSPAGRSAMSSSTLGSVLRSIGSNKPFLLFIVITGIGGVAAGMNTALLFLYVQDYLKLGASFFAVGLLSSFAMIGSTPLWLWAGRRYGKHKTWALGLVFGALVSLPLLIISPGPQALIPLLLTMILCGASQGVIIPLPPSILADVSDYAAWKENTNATGNYFSCLVLLSKITAAVGSSLALLLSDVMGYTPNAHSAANALPLLTPLVIVPAVLQLAAAVLVWRFPLDRRRQGILTRRLAQRQARVELAQ
jgi:GPH family glycoside/pentoside/hexuronide:cation symporter